MCMSTQIAVTPIIRGSQAKKIYQEAHKKPSDKAKLGAEKIMKEFSTKTIIIKNEI